MRVSLAVHLVGSDCPLRHGGQRRPRLELLVVETTQPIRFARACSPASIVALFRPRYVAVVMAHCCNRVSRSRMRCAVRSADRSTARVPWANRQRRWTSPRLLIRPRHRRASRRRFPRCKPQPTREFPSSSKCVNMIDRADQGGRREHADTRNRLEPQSPPDVRSAIVASCRSTPAIFTSRARTSSTTSAQRVAKHTGQFGVGVLEDSGHAPEHRPSPNRYRRGRVHVNDPRIALIRATRAVCHCVRTRCTA